VAQFPTGTSTGWQRSGKNSRIVCGSAQTEIVTATYDVTWDVNDLNTVNFSSNGIDEGISGIMKSAWGFRGDWDASPTGTFRTPPALYPQDYLPDLIIIPNFDDDESWEYPYARVRSAKNGSDANNKVTFEASGMNQGEFYVPVAGVVTPLVTTT
jgi:hypothetical protein